MVAIVRAKHPLAVGGGFANFDRSRLFPASTNEQPHVHPGLSAYYHDSAAALLRDGEIAAAGQEERFTRLIGSPNIVHLQGRLREDLRPSYHATYPLIKSLIRERGAAGMRDLSHALDGGAAVLINDFHLTSGGNQILVDRIRDLLVENEWIDGP